MGQDKLPRHVSVGALPLLLFSSSILAQDLRAVECVAKLPTPRYAANAVYDGDDTIYIFGGVATTDTSILGDTILRDTLKYSISQDTIAFAGLLPTINYGGGAVINNRNQIFYLPGAGIANDYNIYQYFPDSQNFTNVSRLQSQNRYYATIKTSDNEALLVGGSGSGQTRNVWSLDLNTFSSQKIHSLPEEVKIAHGVWVERQGAAYIFNNDVKKIQKFNLATRTSEVLPITMSMYAVESIWDGKFAYILGKLGTFSTFDNITQFDPATESVKYIPVEGYPGSKYLGFAYTTAVYAQRVNRIYMFGGRSAVRPEGSMCHDEIYYISLDPVSPPPTTTDIATPSTSISASPPNPTTMNPGISDCGGKPNTVFPHPEDCSKFIICRYNHTYSFQCPDTLLFHPFMHCTFPDLVDCNACNYNGHE